MPVIQTEPRCMNCDGYDQELFYKVFDSQWYPLKKTETVLRWRGFLVQIRRGRLLCSTGHLAEDFDLLRKYHIRIRPFNKVTGFNYEIDMSSVNETNLCKVFMEPNANYGMCGPNDFGFVDPDWNAFQRCTYGVKVPLKYLDMGVATLVKTLPLLGLHTVMSCAGHLSRSPEIFFKSAYHLKWASLVLPLFESSKNPVLNMPACVSPWTRDWLGHLWNVTNVNPGNELRSRYNVYSSIQALCEEIMDSSLTEQIRTSKSRFSKPSFFNLREMDRGHLATTGRGKGKGSGGICDDNNYRLCCGFADRNQIR
jgi:hypothetical protein